MRLKSGFVLEEVGGTFLAVAVGERAEELKVLIKLNSTGAFLWQRLAQNDVTEADLVDALLEEYEVSREVAEKSVATFVKSVRDGGLLDG
jgi:hypothetical protein